MDSRIQYESMTYYLSFVCNLTLAILNKKSNVEKVFYFRKSGPLLYGI